MIDEERPRNYQEDEFLMREAGYGWRDEGIDSDLLSAIAIREYQIDRMVKEGVRINEADDNLNDEDRKLIQSYHTQVERVNQLKQEKGIAEPPPRDPSKNTYH